MGLIKTAMMSGAAMYGVNKLAQTAQARNNNNNNNNQAPRQDYYDRDDPRFYRSTENTDRRFDSRYSPAREFQERGQASGYYDNEPRQRMYIENEHPVYDQPQFMNQQYDSRPQYESAGHSRSPSSPPAYSYSQYRQQGFVEPEEIEDGRRDRQRGSRGDMINMLAQQAMSMGMGGKKDGGNNDGGKSDLIRRFMGN